MGRLIYGARGMHIEVEDRLLAHLQAVVVSKVRRNEGFVLSWTEAPAQGSGRRSIWIHPYLELVFEYNGNKRPELDAKQADEMMARASTNTGLDLADNAHNPKTAAKVTPVS
jgi:hypothetical protein